jgi:PAS domain S-box-containing protein
MPQRTSVTLATRLTMWTAVTAWLIAAAVWAIVSRTSMEMVNAHVQADATALAETFVAKVTANYERNRRTLRMFHFTVSRQAEGKRIGGESVQDLLRFTFRNTPDLEALWVVGGPGASKHGALPDFDGLSGSDKLGNPDPRLRAEAESLAQEVLSRGRSVVRRRSLPPDEAQPRATAPGSAMARAEPILIGNRIVGVIGYRIALDKWTEGLDAIGGTSPEDGRFMTVDDRLMFTYHPDHDLIGTVAAEGDASLDQLTAVEREAVTRNAAFSSRRRDPETGKLYQRVGLPLPFHEGDRSRLLIVDLPVDPLMAPVQNIVTLLGVGSLVGLLMLGLLLFVMSHRIVGRPLEELRQTIRRLEEREYETPVPLTTRVDEVGAIARALDDLRRSARERTELRAMVLRNARDMERMLAAIDAATDMVLVMDSNRRVLYANHAACDIIGASHAEAIVGKSWKEIIDPATAEQIATLRLFEKLDRTGRWEGIIENYRMLGRSAEALECRITRQPNGDEVMVARDVSARLHAEREKHDLERRLSQMDKMDAVGRLAGGIAHDFNNLLGAMLGYADFLTTDLAPGSPQHDYAVRIVRVGDRAKEMVRQILAFSRANTMDLEPLAIGTVLHDAGLMLKHSIPATVTLAFHVDDPLPKVMANGTQLVQIIVNLALNARDALPDVTGRVTVGARVWDGGEASENGPGDCPVDWIERLILPPEPNRPHVVLEVRDDGSGLAKEIIDKMFEPFFTTKEKGKGTGLGLAMVFGILQAHQGGLSVCSRPRQGTLIRAYIPAMADQAPGRQDDPTGADPDRPALPHSVSSSNRTAAACRVLIVDDERVMGDVISMGLERLGYETAVCENPREALDVFEEEPGAFDAVIADQTMPGMTGMTLIQRLKARSPTLPCILYTGDDSMVDEVAARGAGADAFFLKPVKPSDLAVALTRLVEREAVAG